MEKSVGNFIGSRRTKSGYHSRHFLMFPEIQLQHIAGQN